VLQDVFDWISLDEETKKTAMRLAMVESWKGAFEHRVVGREKEPFSEIAFDRLVMKLNKRLTLMIGIQNLGSGWKDGPPEDLPGEEIIQLDIIHFLKTGRLPGGADTDGPPLNS
jgi:hypothetical protein